MDKFVISSNKSASSAASTSSAASSILAASPSTSASSSAVVPHPDELPCKRKKCSSQPCFAHSLNLVVQDALAQDKSASSSGNVGNRGHVLSSSGLVIVIWVIIMNNASSLSVLGDELYNVDGVCTGGPLLMEHTTAKWSLCM
ncbi:uncharacterized protein Dwil_GK26826 [Drosophila willistoni]|uniref:Uncharacterized protein n=1 Tax=Drosophila willistoni TaxID=7260 RepID=A0A0Q9WXS4_DROWI|nr:uncharacterized protein Dwil_GK26826 [Drosophila willistoni]